MEEYLPDHVASATTVPKKSHPPAKKRAATKKPKEVATGKKRAKLKAVIDLTSKSTIAGKHISTMNAIDLEEVVTVLGKTAQRNENKVV